ncbi:MAG: N-acetylgalactosamine-4-sulfatase, partial [Verrucomicrobiota bacterium]
TPDGLSFDGVTIRPLLENEEAPSDWPDRILVTDSQRVKDPIKWRKSSVMTSDWRLVSNPAKDGTIVHELYAIKTDPKQETNVLADHPEVAERLKTFYDEWWEELEPTFGEPTRIRIGSDAENPSRLTSHDWITTGSTPWNQGHVRKGTTKPETFGAWHLEIESAGEYSVELRRWPNEGPVADHAITDPEPPGENVPGVDPFRMTPGKAIGAVSASIEIGGETYTQEVAEGASHVTFPVKLEYGPTELFGKFIAEDGTETGAFFAYIERLSKLK